MCKALNGQQERRNRRPALLGAGWVAVLVSRGCKQEEGQACVWVCSSSPAKRGVA